MIDARDVDGCWYEADLVKVTKNPKSSIWSTDSTTTTNNNNNNNEEKEVAMETEESSAETSKNSKTVSSLPEGVVEDDGFFYHIKYEGYVNYCNIFGGSLIVESRGNQSRIC